MKYLSKSAKVLGWAILLFGIGACVSRKENSFSYSIGNFAIDSGRHLRYVSYFISHKDCLFEFIVQNKLNFSIKEGVQGGDAKLSSDTTSVVLMSGEPKFYEFDTFALNAKVEFYGSLKDKRKGIRLTRGDGENMPKISFSPPKKLVSNGVQSAFSVLNEENAKAQDSFLTKVILVENPSFNSIYALNGFRFPDRNYCIVGFQVIAIKQKVGFEEELLSMRQINEKEKAICDNMILLSKQRSLDSTTQKL